MRAKSRWYVRTAKIFLLHVHSKILQNAPARSQLDDQQRKSGSHRDSSIGGLLYAGACDRLCRLSVSHVSSRGQPQARPQQADTSTRKTDSGCCECPHSLPAVRSIAGTADRPRAAKAAVGTSTPRTAETHTAGFYKIFLLDHKSP